MSSFRNITKESNRLKVALRWRLHLWQVSHAGVVVIVKRKGSTYEHIKLSVITKLSSPLGQTRLPSTAQNGWSYFSRVANLCSPSVVFLQRHSAHLNIWHPTVGLQPQNSGGIQHKIKTFIREIQKLLNVGTIKLSESPWGAQVLGISNGLHEEVWLP